MKEPVPDILTPFRIRDAHNSDSEAILALIATALSEVGLEVDTVTTDADLLDIEGSYQKQGGVFEVIEDQRGAVIGSIGLYPLSHDTCELRKMYLVPHLRGKGVGRYLLQRVVIRAKELGFQRMTLETSSKLQAANHLYTSFGFQPAALSHLSNRADQAYSLEL